MSHSTYEVIYITPGKRGTCEEQFFGCLDDLKKRLRSFNSGIDRILKLSVFFHPDEKQDYLSQWKNLYEGLKLYFGNKLPTFSIITNLPSDDYAISLEATIYTNTKKYQLERKTLDGYNYTVLSYDHHKEVYAAGICLQYFDEQEVDIHQHAEHTFLVSSKILAAEGLDFSNVIRIWHYIEDIVGTYQKGNNTYQNYQVFNDIRTSYYSKCEFKNGYPASTGIGMTKGGIIIEFIAINTTNEILTIPVKNPLQRDAYSYSENVLIGNHPLEQKKSTTPKFERAVLVANRTNGYLFISGTASIKDEKTIAPGSVTEQTKITLDNIDSLIQQLSKEYLNLQNPEDCYFRVYIKRKEDIPEVRLICEDYFKDFAGQYLVANICRTELLVEIECISIFKGKFDIIKEKLNYLSMKNTIKRQQDNMISSGFLQPIPLS